MHARAHTLGEARVGAAFARSYNSARELAWEGSLVITPKLSGLPTVWTVEIKTRWQRELDLNGHSPSIPRVEAHTNERDHTATHAIEFFSSERGQDITPLVLGFPLLDTTLWIVGSRWSAEPRALSERQHPALTKSIAK